MAVYNGIVVVKINYGVLIMKVSLKSHLETTAVSTFFTFNPSFLYFPGFIEQWCLMHLLGETNYHFYHSGSHALSINNQPQIVILHVCHI